MHIKLTFVNSIAVGQTMEKLMNEENERDHGISAGVKEGPADCIRMDEVAQH